MPGRQPGGPDAQLEQTDSEGAAWRGERLRQIGQGNARRSERVVSRDLGCLHIDRDITGGRSAAHILSHLFAEIAVESLYAAGKLRPDVSGAENLDEERGGHRVSRISFAWARFARSNAGAGAGGSSNSSTKRR